MMIHVKPCQLTLVFLNLLGYSGEFYSSFDWSAASFNTQI